MFGGSVCAGAGSQTPWCNVTGMCAGWANEVAATLHRDYGHEVRNVARGSLSTGGDILNKLFRSSVLPREPDVVVIGFAVGSMGLPFSQADGTHNNTSETLDLLWRGILGILPRQPPKPRSSRGRECGRSGGPMGNRGVIPSAHIKKKLLKTE